VQMRGRSECGAPAAMPTSWGWKREDVGTSRAGPRVVPGNSGALRQ